VITGPVKTLNHCFMVSAQPINGITAFTTPRDSF
jgi:hypothetical protein